MSTSSLSTDAAAPPPPALHLHDPKPHPSSNTSSLIRKKLALISISPSPSTKSIPKRRHEQISEDTEMAALDQSSSSPPRKVARKIRVGGMIFTRTVVCGGCKVKYVIQRIESECFRISDGKTTRDVPFSRKHINFDCPCGERFEITMNVTMNLSLAEKKEWERKLNGKT